MELFKNVSNNDDIITIKMIYTEGRKGCNESAEISFPRKNTIFGVGRYLIPNGYKINHKATFDGQKKTPFTFLAKADQKHKCLTFELTFYPDNKEPQTFTSSSTSKLIKSAFGDASVSCPQLFLYGCPLLQMMFSIISDMNTCRIPKKRKPKEMKIHYKFTHYGDDSVSDEEDDEDDISNSELVIEMLDLGNDIVEIEDESKDDIINILKKMGLTGTSSSRLFDDEYISKLGSNAIDIKNLIQGKIKESDFGNCSWEKASGRKRKSSKNSNENSKNFKNSNKKNNDVRKSLKRLRSVNESQTVDSDSDGHVNDDIKDNDNNEFIYQNQIGWTTNFYGDEVPWTVDYSVKKRKVCDVK